MAIDYLHPVFIPRYQVARDQYAAWEYDEELTVPSNGKALIIPTTIKGISVTLKITDGSGKIQSTVSSLDKVLAETDVEWVDWDSGEIAGTTSDVSAPVTAIRQVNTSGTTRLLLRAQ